MSVKRPAVLAAFVAFVGLAAEAIAAAQAFSGVSGPHWVMLLAAHVAASVAFAIGWSLMLPERYARQPVPAGAFVLAIVLFMPLFGMAGCLFAILPALQRQKAEAAGLRWLHPQSVHLPARSSVAREAGQFSWLGGLAGSLQYASDPNKRIAALIATLALKDQDAVPLLRCALRDSEDEVRLLAYALLNRKEKAIEARIRDRKLAKDDEQVLRSEFLRHKALAHDYWELAQLGIPRGSTQMSLCARAREHVREAQRLRPEDGGLQFLLGRLLLAERQLAAAAAAFEQARVLGVDERQLAPQFAEIAFLDGRYGDIAGLLMRAGPGRSQPGLVQVAAYWNGVANAGSAA